MTEPIVVAIDTCGYMKESFKFQGPKLGALVRAAQRGWIQLLVSTVTDREVRKHMRECITEAHASLNKARWLDATRLAPFEAVRLSLDLKALLADIERQWRLFLRETGAHLVSADQVNVEAVLDAYFSSRPPFENKKDKKHEFPDAIFVESIRRWADTNDKMVLIVSNDAGVQAACIGRLQAAQLSDVLAACVERGAYSDFAGQAIAFIEQTEGSHEKFGELGAPMPSSIRSPVEFVVHEEWPQRSLFPEQAQRSILATQVDVQRWDSAQVVDVDSDTVVIERRGLGEAVFVPDVVFEEPDALQGSQIQRHDSIDPMKEWFASHAPEFGFSEFDLDAYEDGDAADEDDALNLRSPSYECGHFPIVVRFIVKKTNNVEQPFRIAESTIVEPLVLHVALEDERGRRPSSLHYAFRSMTPEQEREEARSEARVPTRLRIVEP